MKEKIDAVDKVLLKLLQEDAQMPLNQLAEAVNLSPTPCWRRIQRLRDSGVISKQVVLVNPSKVNVGVTVFMAVRTNQHNQRWFDKFRAAVEVIPEVVEFYRMSGEVDYLLRVVVPDIAAFDQVYQRLIKQVELFDVSSSFAMEEIKFTTALPLDYTL
jgi:Lrp/AsnC family transcriptional regulator